MQLQFLLVGILTIVILLYLAYTLLYPEKF